MKNTKSDYTWTLEKKVILVQDLNFGGKSVTNDIQNVINEIYYKLGENIKKYKIIYKDSEGIWDGVTPVWGIKKCVAFDFFHLGETDLELALKKLKKIKKLETKSPLKVEQRTV